MDNASYDADHREPAASPQAGRLKIGIISAGKVGAALGSALRAVGHDIIGAYASSEASIDRLETMLPSVPARPVEDIVRDGNLVLFAVPDDELAGLVEGLATLGTFRHGQMVMHTSGRYGVGVLAPAAQAGALTLAIHPAMTFTGTSLDVARLAGCPFAVTGPATYLPIGQALVTEIGGTPVVVHEEDRALYHAALAHGANHLVTLVAQSMKMLEAAGIGDPGSYLRPLTEAALDEALRSGEALLTGPVVRGDVGTLREHLSALEALVAISEDSANRYGMTYASYVNLMLATADSALRRRVITKDQWAHIVATLPDTLPEAGV